MNHRALIAFGANQGDRSAALDRVARELRELESIRDVVCSDPYETPAIGGATPQGAYLNAVLRVTTTAPPQQLFRTLVSLEHQLGRRRRERWEARPIDLDLLLYDDRVIHTPNLTLPHPRMSFRRFVLQPAVDVAPDWIHPICRASLADLLGQIDREDPRIVVVSRPLDDRSSQSKLIAHVAQESIGWEIQWFDHLPGAQETAPVGRLLVSVDLESSPAMKSWVNGMWRGPRLDLRDVAPEAFQTEIVAAIDAMLPWDQTSCPGRSTGQSSAHDG